MQHKISISHKGGGGYSLKESAKKFLDSIGLLNTARKIKRIIFHVTPVPSIVLNVNKANYDKKCLLVYITNPFVSKEIGVFHQNQWQAVEMARVIGTFKYNVDVVQCSSTEAAQQVKGKYDLIVGLIPRGVDYWSGHMNEGCKLVAYMTSMNLGITRINSMQRVMELYQRRGVILVNSAIVDNMVLTKDLENFDAAWFIGNTYNFYSYENFNMPPTYYIKNSGYNFDWLHKDIIRNKKNFIYFSSGKQVHRGLDLLLEIFSKPDFDCNLYICGPFMGEEDFCSEYKRELFETPNIFPIGFVDINGEEFRELTEKCAYTLMPSCAEGCSGSVLTMMSAGVIPIVSKECGLYDDEVINLPDCKINTIEKFIHDYAAKSDEWIKQQSSHVVEIIKTRYSRKNFTDSVIAAMNELTKGE